MCKKILLFFILTHCCIKSFCQPPKPLVQKEFFGYGWIVSVPLEETLFIPMTGYHYPTLKQYFLQKEKFGLTVGKIFYPGHLLKNYTTVHIVYPNGCKGEMYITPVIAHYLVKDTTYYGFNQYAYAYKNKMDTTTFQIVHNAGFEFKYLTKPKN
jgi:hypothetical protein